jgi:hypothetical protein
MSAALAIATATAALGQMLQEAVGAALPGAKVTKVRPAAAGAGLPSVGVNVFLYQVGPNAAARSLDTPTRDGAGNTRLRPVTGVDLHYLLSFYGDDLLMEPQRLLGVVIGTLHARPLLTRKLIRDTVANPQMGFLAGSALAEQPELVRFTPEPMSLDELSKLWSVFFQTPYSLSVAYQGSVVLVENDETPAPALPVRTRNLYVIPVNQPRIERAVDAANPAAPVVTGSVLAVTGDNLVGTTTVVRVGGVAITPDSTGPRRIELTVPTTVPTDLRAGAVGVVVEHPLDMGTPPVPHAGLASNVAPLILHPRVTAPGVSNISGAGADPRDATVTTPVSPTVGARQRVELLLNETTATAPKAYAFAAPERAADADSLDIAVTAVKAGTYLLRLRVDGAASPLDLDPASPGFGPTVTIS